MLKHLSNVSYRYRINYLVEVFHWTGRVRMKKEAVHEGENRVAIATLAWIVGHICKKGKYECFKSITGFEIIDERIVSFPTRAWEETYDSPYLCLSVTKWVGAGIAIFLTKNTVPIDEGRWGLGFHLGRGSEWRMILLKKERKKQRFEEKQKVYSIINIATSENQTLCTFMWSQRHCGHRKKIYCGWTWAAEENEWLVLILKRKGKGG